MRGKQAQKISRCWISYYFHPNRSLSISSFLSLVQRTVNNASFGNHVINGYNLPILVNGQKKKQATIHTEWSYWLDKFGLESIASNDSVVTCSTFYSLPTRFSFLRDHDLHAARNARHWHTLKRPTVFTSNFQVLIWESIFIWVKHETEISCQHTQLITRTD